MKRTFLCCILLVCFAENGLAKLPVRYDGVVERLAEKWVNEPEFFQNNPAYSPYIVNNVLIYGFGSSPYMHQGENMIYYNYSDPTVFFLPPKHQGGRFSLYVFYHELTPVSNIKLSLDEKEYFLQPVGVTKEVIYNAWLQKKPIWEPGLVLTIEVPKDKRYIKLESDLTNILFAAVTFDEKNNKVTNLSSVKTPKIEVVPQVTKPTTSTIISPEPSFQSGVVLVSPITGNTWPRFTSSQWKFSIAYPEGWTCKETSGQSILEIVPPKGEKKVMITRDQFAGKKLADFVTKMEQIIGFRTIQREEFSKGERILQTAQASLGEQNFYLDILYVQSGNNVFTITAIAPEPNKDDYAKEIRDILFSFSPF